MPAPQSAPQGAPEPPRHPWRSRILVLVGILLVALNLRIAIASVSPILDRVEDDLSLTDAQAGLLGTIPVASFALFGSLTPALARRFGLEPLLVAAMLLSAGGEVVRATVTTSSAFLAWSVIALAGMGMGNVLLPPIVKRYFPDRIGPVTAAYSVAMSFSTALPPLLAVPAAERLGWRTSLGAWAVVGLVAVVPWVVVIARSSAARTGLRDVLRRAPSTTPRLESRHRRRGRVWRSHLAWGLAIAFAMNSLNSYVVFAWLPRMLADAGYEPAAAGSWLALVAILGLVPALVAPPLAVRLRNPYAVVVVFVTLFVAGWAGMLLAPEHALPWAVGLGLGVGTFPLLLTLINLRTRTSAGASSLSGFTQGVGYAVSGVGPLLVGVLYGATGGWTAPSAVLAVSSAVLLVAGFVACRPVMLEDTWGRRPADDVAPGPATA
ncbi:MFS transporter [Actinotalea ferrariae]|uniref:MFS transporter n=1 Tax=Actinotalea ferrariae TaxID=1386098 RepID=UPI001C8C0831|nr:MFS transporter [Actinotalea ferrariae]MBX9246440.1 MFS transporter [Actinotalea ferrariae]